MRSSSAPGRPRRTLRVIGIGVAVLLAGWLVWLVAQPPILQARARADLAAGLDAQRASFEASVHEDARLLAAELGEPAGRQLGYTCVVAHSDQGWMVVRYRQECTLRAVTFYPTTRTPAETEARIAALPSAEQRFGKRWRDPESVQRCRSLFYSTPTTAIRHWDADCRGNALRTPIGAVWVTFDALPQDVPGDKGSWVVVDRAARVSTTELGCRPLPVFCVEPFDTPVVID
ncbi:hypothetical protein [Micropruina sp.]|uniref:hypothetical protein n=1 Tax=Micropruina sp. TaxID=2737536 RepID=UPI0039E6F00B